MRGLSLHFIRGLRYLGTRVEGSKDCGVCKVFRAFESQKFHQFYRLVHMQL